MNLFHFLACSLSLSFLTIFHDLLHQAVCSLVSYVVLGLRFVFHIFVFVCFYWDFFQKKMSRYMDVFRIKNRKFEFGGKRYLFLCIVLDIFVSNFDCMCVCVCVCVCVCE